MAPVKRLAPGQGALLTRLMAVGSGLNATFDSVLLLGARGCAKRTIAAYAAAELGLEVVEVPMAGLPASVTGRLVGNLSPTPDSTASSEGELSRVTPTMLYLSHLDSAHESIHQFIHRAITTRRYIDGDGQAQTIDENIWIVGSLTSELENPLVTVDHWLCTAFSARVMIECPRSRQDLSAICQEMARQSGLVRALSEGAMNLVVQTPLPTDNLHALRRWIESAAFSDTGETPDDDRLYQAMSEDLNWLVGRIQYRGKTLTLARFEKWAGQFSSDLRGVPSHLLRELVENYHISQASYHEGINILIGASEIPARAKVSFCRWQELGTSGPRVANDFKNQSRWKLLPEVDCDMPADTWPDLETLGCSHIIIVDDFVGSGQTLLGLVKGQASPIRRLGEKYKAISVTIMLIAGFEQAIEDFLVQAPQIKIIVWKRLSDRDRCFSSQSKIFTDTSLRARFETFCVKVASTNYPSVRAKHRLGHNGIGCLTSFAETVPNNTLPIIWHDQGHWFPLLPASGML